MFVEVVKGTLRMSKKNYAIGDILDIPDENEVKRLVDLGIVEIAEAETDEEALSSSDEEQTEEDTVDPDTLTDEEYTNALAEVSQLDISSELVNSLIEAGFQSIQSIVDGENSELRTVIKNPKQLKAIRTKAKELLAGE